MAGEGKIRQKFQAEIPSSCQRRGFLQCCVGEVCFHQQFCRAGKGWHW